MQELMYEVAFAVALGVVWALQDYVTRHDVRAILTTPVNVVSMVGRMTTKRGSGRVADGPKGTLATRTRVAAKVTPQTTLGAVPALSHVWQDNPGDKPGGKMIPVPTDLGVVLSVYAATPYTQHWQTGMPLHTSRMVSFVTRYGSTTYRFGVSGDALVTVKG